MILYKRSRLLPTEVVSPSQVCAGNPWFLAPLLRSEQLIPRMLEEQLRCSVLMGYFLFPRSVIQSPSLGRPWFHDLLKDSPRRSKELVRPCLVRLNSFPPLHPPFCFTACTSRKKTLIWTELPPRF